MTENTVYLLNYKLESQREGYTKIAGIFSDIEAAKAGAKTHWRNRELVWSEVGNTLVAQADAVHSYTIKPFILNKVIGQGY